ncbi:MAG: hypothetical protein OYK82_06290 [Gammaproteobacteria bacterium]|nr:hypothetical protein [Gammaproteobacteria bacterium]
MTTTRSRYGRTIYIPPGDGTRSLTLRRRRLTAESAGGAYDEAWLQDLLFRNPEILPIGEIDDAFDPATPLCRELPTAAGPIDIAYVSQTGRLTLVECKLWKNPEARREVVAQILDYAKEITRFSYQDLIDAVCRARGEQPNRNRLFELARAENDELDEADFVDDVSRHLADGRFLLLVVGDGIREGVERIAEHLRRFAGIQFTFGLVELAMFELPADDGPAGLIVEPRVLARTVEIERAVVRRADSSVAVEEPPVPSTGGRSGRPLTEDEFYGRVRRLDADLPDHLRDFFGRVEELGLVVEAHAASMVLRWDREDGRTVYFGILRDDGRLEPRTIVRRAGEFGDERVGVAYLEALASLIPHSTVEATGKTNRFRLVVRGRPPEFATLLDRTHEWLDAIQRTMDAINRLAAE